MPKQGRKIFFNLLFFALIFFSVELLSMLGLFFLKEIRHIEYQPVSLLSLSQKKTLQRFLAGSPGYIEYDSILGWTIRPNSESGNHLSRSNSEGLRADRSYPAHPPPGCLRIAAFGDSFTHSTDIANTETWESRLELMDRRLEVLNFGVGGYGLDQAFLRYKKKGIDFHPHIVFIGFVSDDINRTVSVFRPFYDKNTGLPLTKPRFVLQNDRLILLKNPISTRQDLDRLLQDDLNMFNKLKAHDYYATSGYPKMPGDFLASVRMITLFANRVWGKAEREKENIFHASSEAYRITTKLIEVFYEQVEANDSLPVIILFPQREDLKLYIKEGRTSYTPLVEDLKNKGYNFIDLSVPLKAAVGTGEEAGKLIPSHYSAEANKLIASYIYAYLQKRQLLKEPTDKMLGGNR